MTNDYDPAKLVEIATTAIRVQRDINLLSRILYVAHITYGKRIEDLAQQTGRSPKEINDRISFVASRIRSALDK